MDYPSIINSPTYTLTNLSTSSAAVTIEEQYKNTTRAIIDNTMGSDPVFIVSGLTSPTAVFPTSASVASIGMIVGAGTVQEYTKPSTHGFIAGIRKTGTADVYITLTSGE